MRDYKYSMIKPTDNVLFATIDSIPTLDKSLAAREILSLSQDVSYWDKYRHTRMFPLMTKNGGYSEKGVKNNQTGDFIWTPFAPKVIVDWFEDYVFPWIGCKARVMTLVTQPGVSNYEHIDCNSNELNTLQHKFRMVLQGKTDTLYWLTDKGRVYAPDVDKPFIIDGGWPHGMINSTDEVKLTIALGAPWNGKEHYDDITILQDKNNFKMPEDVSHLWQT